MTPLERVARAICEQAGLRPDDMVSLTQQYRSEILGTFSRRATDDFRPAWRFFVPHAYAAIEGMREPSEGMLWCINPLNSDQNVLSPDHGTDAWRWRIMIARALTESPDAA